MLLSSLSLKNFCCYSSIDDIAIHRLTVFIGENDAGKSVLLSSIRLLLKDEMPIENQYYLSENGQREDTVSITGKFVLEDFDTLPTDYKTSDGKYLLMTKTFSAKQGVRKCEVQGMGYVDERFNTFKTQSAEIQKELLLEIGITPGSNGTLRNGEFLEACATGIVPKKITSVSVSFSNLSEHLPLFESFASTDYKQPDALVQLTLQNVIYATINPVSSSTGEPELLPTLQDVKKNIHQALNAKVAEMRTTLIRQIPKMKDVQVSEPVIDFSKSVSSMSLQLDLGQGFQTVTAFGAGTNRKLWMGLLEWERQIQKEYDTRNVLRVYDEPDVNLDYTAERKLFGNILDATQKAGSRTQAIVATHSMTLIDRSPAESIGLIRVKDDGTRQIFNIGGNTDDDLKLFITSVGRTVGISNSALFYERVFIAVEGETEENALPILYRHLYGRSLIEDGIVLVNLQTCGAWRSVLGILGRHRADTTVLLLDMDCQDPNSSALVTPEVLVALNFPPEWKTNNCFYAGNKEFEDEFTNGVIVETLNAYWPKADNTLWTEQEIQDLRVNSPKFSEDLKTTVMRSCIKNRRNSVRKPEIGEKMAHTCRAKNIIPPTVNMVFVKARALSGL